jgi:phosphomevalonate kinase
MKVILISGKAGSGKDEVAKLLKMYLGNTVITKLAKYIKLFAAEMTDWDGKEDDKPRTFLQEMGDNLRLLDKNFLTKRMVEDLKLYEKFYDYVIISDVRLVNEIEYIKANYLNVVTIRVNAKESTRKLTEKEKEHITETELDNYNNFDYVIENDFKDDLKDEVKEILGGIE